MEDIHGVKSTGERIKNIIISPFSGEGDICPLEKETQTSIRVEIMNMCFGIHFQNVCRVMSAFATPTVKSTIQSSIDGYLDTSRFLLVYQIAKNTKNLESKKSFLENNSASTSVNESFQEVILSDPEPHSQFYDNIEEILTFNPHEIIQKIGPNSDVQLNYFTQFFLDTVYSTITFNLHIFRFISKKTATFAAPLIEQYLNILLSVLSYFIPSRRVRQCFSLKKQCTNTELEVYIKAKRDVLRACAQVYTSNCSSCVDSGKVPVFFFDKNPKPITFYEQCLVPAPFVMECLIHPTQPDLMDSVKIFITIQQVSLTNTPVIINGVDCLVQQIFQVLSF
ncbi:hypothetical protein HZS_6028 [Henneguya salminicola]|nr:hypothetical protein HZS_6028 [Henneguya salminicola]